MPLDLSDIVNDQDLAENVVILRSSGHFAPGGFASTTAQVPACGIVAPADDQALQQVPEGDRVTGSLQFLTATRIFPTHASTQAGLSDTIQWNGDVYRVAHVGPWVDNGFWSAILVRMTGN